MATHDQSETTTASESKSTPQNCCGSISFPPQPLLSLAVVPFLGGLLVAQSLKNSLLELSKNSEELLRGDRLPILSSPEISSLRKTD